MDAYRYRAYLILRVFLICILLKRAESIVWLSEPVNLQQCVGHDVNYTWHYDITSTSHVSMMFWLFMGTGNTIIGWQENKPTTVYPAYRGRVQLLSGYNAGIQLFNVTKADSGEYKLEVSGPGVVLDTSLIVYSEDDLHPMVEVDGFRVNLNNESLRLNNSDKIVLHLTTGSNLTAKSITFNVIDNEKTVLHICHNDTVCEYDWTDFTPGNVALQIIITYSFCSPVQDVIYMDINEPAAFTNTTAVIIAVVCVSVAVLLLVFIVKYRIKGSYSKMKKTTGHVEVQVDESNGTELALLESNEHQEVDEKIDVTRTAVGAVDKTTDATETIAAVTETTTYVAETTTDVAETTEGGNESSAAIVSCGNNKQIETISDKGTMAKPGDMQSNVAESSQGPTRFGLGHDVKDAEQDHLNELEQVPMGQDPSKFDP